MTKLKEKYPLLAGLLVLLALVIAMVIGGVLEGIVMLFPPLMDALGDYGLQLVAELTMLVIMVGMTFLFRMGRVFTCRGRGFGKSLAIAAALLVLYGIAGVGSLVLSIGSPLQQPLHILLFVLCMAAIGITEELTFRGLIAGMFYDKYGGLVGMLVGAVMVLSIL